MANFKQYNVLETDELLIDCATKTRELVRDQKQKMLADLACPNA